MPIYRCNRCGHISESPTAGTQVPCGQCTTPCSVYDTVFFIQKLLERYSVTLKELKELKEAKTLPQAVPVGDVLAAAAAQPPMAAQVAEYKLHNTNTLATAAQHDALANWFKTHQIEARFNHANMDTSGYFDDAACKLGDNYTLFGELLDRVTYAYRKNHSNVTLELNQLAQKDGQAINQLCKQLYEHTFFSRYHYQKPEKIVRLTLQTAPNIRQFFEGGWLEWYATMTMLSQLQQQQLTFSCARGMQVVFANEDLHELDVVALPQKQSPICIECKSGEFRREIDKYQRLRKRLNIERDRFIICATDLSDEQANSLSAMYDLSFISVGRLGELLQKLLNR